MLSVFYVWFKINKRLNDYETNKEIKRENEWNKSHVKISNQYEVSKLDQLNINITLFVNIINNNKYV